MFVALFFTYYTFLITELFKSDTRKTIKQKNELLDSYRSKPIKTLEEQKEFLDLKSPYVKYKWKWSKEVIALLLFKIIMYMVVINVYLQIFVWLGIVWKLWQVILLIIIFPLFVSLILGKFNLDKTSLLVFFRGGKKNDNNQTGRQKINK
jgi:ABC-type multidrug transport system fused ATPase/permease subunit